MFVDVALKAVVNLLFQHSRAGVPEHADGDLTAVVVPTLDIDQDFDVTRFAVAGDNARDLQIRRGFARGFNGDLRDRSDCKSIFNHDSDRYMRSGYLRITGRKEFTSLLHGRLVRCERA